MKSVFSSRRLLRAREIQKARDQRIGAVHFLLDVSGHLLRDCVFVGHLARQHLGGSLHRAQGIAQLVRQPGSQLPQRRQAIGAAHLGFGFFQMPIGFGQFFGGGLRFSCFVAVGLASWLVRNPTTGKKSTRRISSPVSVDFLIRPQEKEETTNTGRKQPKTITQFPIKPKLVAAEITGRNRTK